MKITLVSLSRTASAVLFSHPRNGSRALYLSGFNYEFIHVSFLKNVAVADAVSRLSLHNEESTVDSEVGYVNLFISVLPVLLQLTIRTETHKIRF